MIAEYRFKYDEAFIAETVKSYRRSHPARMLRWAMKSFGFFGLGLLALVGIYARDPAITGVFVFFIVVLALAPVFDYWWAKRRIRKSPSFNADVLVRFSSEGFFAEEPNARVELAWSAFTDGSRLPHGLLLFTAPDRFYWLPDRALTSGSVQELAALLEQKVRKFRRV